jgi:hypothetical protein
MPGEFEGIAKILDSKVVEKTYDDGASEIVQEVGKLGVDLVKTLRLFTAPLQIAATYQDRLVVFLKQLNARVPEERRIDVPPQIGGPALQALRYIDEGDALWGMFTELLCKAADSSSVSLVHPAFIHILQQLTRDEAYLLARLGQGAFKIKDQLDLVDSGRRFDNRKVMEDEIPYGELHRPEALDIYYAHLESLSLVTWPVVNENPIFDQQGSQTGTERNSELQLTKFGQLLVDACTTTPSS